MRLSLAVLPFLAVAGAYTQDDLEMQRRVRTDKIEASLRMQLAQLLGKVTDGQSVVDALQRDNRLFDIRIQR